MKIRKEFLLENMYGSKAYWINPSGKIMEVQRRHITSVLDNPEGFGYTKQELEELYHEFNEKIGFEGKAREKIMTDLINKGWIRIRWNPKTFTWIVQSFDLSKKTKDYIQQWANEIISNPDLKYSNVYVLPIKNGLTPSQYSLIDISHDVLYNESDKKDNSKYLLEFVENFSKK